MINLTKHEHACVSIWDDHTRIVIDPGVFTSGHALRDADAVLLTHQHFDHMDADSIRETAASNPALRIFGPDAVVAQLASVGLDASPVANGDSFTVGNITVEVRGTHHQLGHPDFPPSANVGYLVNGSVFHPGDALTVVEGVVLLCPVDAPWLTVPALISYVRASRPTCVLGVHDGLLNEHGLRVVDEVLEMEAQGQSKEIRRLVVGETVSLPSAADSVVERR